MKALLPHSQIVVVPGNGHDQVDSDGTGCVAKALTRFTARKPVGRPCAGKSRTRCCRCPRAPLSLSEFRTPGADPRRTAGARCSRRSTRSRMRASAALEAVYGGFAPRGGGLRGGSFARPTPSTGR